jgi:hypothetical protein
MRDVCDVGNVCDVAACDVRRGRHGNMGEVAVTSSEDVDVSSVPRVRVNV